MFSYLFWTGPPDSPVDTACVGPSVYSVDVPSMCLPLFLCIATKKIHDQARIYIHYAAVYFVFCHVVVNGRIFKGEVILLSIFKDREG